MNLESASTIVIDVPLYTDVHIKSCPHYAEQHHSTCVVRISLTARTDLVVVDYGAMNADRYIRSILEEHVEPFVPYIGENFIVMDDNARPHRARIVQEYLEEVEVSRMEWPARSPDLNPIEQVWDNLNRGRRSSENHPATLNT